MFLLCFLISLSIQKIAAHESFEKRLPETIPINDLTFVTYDKRRPMYAENGKRKPKFAVYSKRVSELADEYKKRLFPAIDSEYLDLVQLML